MPKWMLQMKKADFAGIAEELHIDPLLVRLLVNRGISSKEEIDKYLNGDMSLLHSPKLLGDMDKATKLIISSLSNNEHIRIVGDYDADGVCSTAILMKGLLFAQKSLGQDSVIDYRIPHRVKDGYGLNIDIIDEAHDAGVDLILTCDNGIAARNEIAHAKELGMKVVVTDHHEVPFTLEGETKQYIMPDADAVVDPKREDEDYPFSGICGAVVAYKLILALIHDISENHNISLQDKDALLKELTELAGLATVTDIMELRDENRPLLKEALKLMNNSSNIGIRALLSVNGLLGASVNVFHLGFVLGPCINASGRIDSADRALELLLAKTEQEAMALATELKSMNDSRKLLTDKACDEAIESLKMSGHDKDKVLVVFIPECHESVAGIVAGRIKERYLRPTLVITRGEEGAKGSARSVEVYNMYEEMNRIADIFIKFGGHSQAAGFSLEENRIDELRERLNANCTYTEKELEGFMKIDADAPCSYCNEAFMKQLDSMEPTGNGNERCMFARKNMQLISAKFFGDNNKVGKYKLKDSDGIISELTLFRRNNELINYLADKFGQEIVDKSIAGKGDGSVTVSVAYRPSWNEYQGRKSVQLIIEDFC